MLATVFSFNPGCNEGELHGTVWARGNEDMMHMPVKSDASSYQCSQTHFKLELKKIVNRLKQYKVRHCDPKKDKINK